MATIQCLIALVLDLMTLTMRISRVLDNNLVMVTKMSETGGQRLGLIKIVYACIASV